MRRLCAVVLMLMVAGGLAGRGMATADHGTITISPPLKQMTFGPGLLQSNDDIQLTNTTNSDFQASVKVVDFNTLDNYGGITFQQAGTPLAKYGLANWMSLPNGNSVTVPKGQSITVPVVVQNRPDLTPGGHYGAVVIRAASSNGAAGTVGFNQELVSLVFLKKLGGDISGLDLQSLSAPKGFSIPTTVSATFKSTGNVYVVPRGYITITDPSGKVVAKGTINTDSEFIIQGTSRQLVTIMQPMADAKLVGTYKITAYYRYDGQNTFSQKSIYFKHGSLPKVVIYIVILTVVILLLVLYSIHRKAIKTHRRIYQ